VVFIIDLRLYISTLFSITRKFFARALLGTVRAGSPSPATQEEPEVLAIDDYLVGDPNRTSQVTVRGDSMKDAGLLDGDIAIVESKRPTRSGDIVVARVDGELTVKTLRDDNGEYVLEPANIAYSVIRPRESLEIVGVVTGSFRRFKTVRSKSTRK
jgi:repressor LexA